MRTVLFDLDGTFADTLPALSASLDAALGEAGLAAIGPGLLRPVVSLGTRAIVGLGVDPDSAVGVRVRERFLEHYHAASRDGDATPCAGIPPLLDALTRRGLRWGIVTNKLERFARPLVERLDQRRECACLVAGDTAVHPKPHPAPLLFACQLAGVSPGGSVYVGDAQGDITAGRRAGMRTVAAAYGYLIEGADPSTWGANAVIETPAALLDWIDAPGADAPGARPR